MGPKLTYKLVRSKTAVGQLLTFDRSIWMVALG